MGRGWVKLVIAIASVLILFATSRWRSGSGDGSSRTGTGSEVEIATSPGASETPPSVTVTVADSAQPSLSPPTSSQPPTTTEVTASTDALDDVPLDPTSSTVEPTTIATVVTTAVPTTTEAQHTGAATSCGDGQALDDPDGDGWGECTARPPPLQLATLVWWRTVAPSGKDWCDAGYAAADAASFVPGGLDRPTFDFLCRNLAAGNPSPSPATDPAQPPASTP